MNTFTSISAIIFALFTCFCHGSDLIGNSAEYYGAYEAEDEHIGSGGDVACCGFSSCESADIYAVAEAREFSFIYCYGSKACSEADILITNEVQCYGTGSCYDAEIDSHAVSHYLRCYGSYSCATTNTIRSGQLLVGNGYRSLLGATVQAEMSQDKKWSADLYGYQAAKNAVIYVDDAIEFIINAKGYESLIDSNLKCMGGATCTVSCKIGSCVNSYIYVDDSSTVTVTCESLDYCITQVSDEDALPILSNTDDFDDLTLGVASLAKQLNNDVVLNDDDVTSLSCEEELECSQSEFNSDTESQIIYCEGYHACQEMSINRAEINTYCSGHYSCHDSTITSSSFAACSGFISCRSSIFNNLPYILGIGYLSAENAIITDVDQLDAHGNNVFTYATISVSANHDMIISSYGFVTFNEATIYVEGSLTADFKGYLSGYNTDIYCYANSKCSISCYYYSCKGLTIYYSKSSKIDLQCSDESDDTDYCGELVELSQSQLHEYQISKMSKN